MAAPATGESEFIIIAGELQGWPSNPNDIEWNETEAHTVTFALCREAEAEVVLRVKLDTGQRAEVTLDFTAGSDGLYTALDGAPGLRHHVPVASGSWARVFVDLDAVVASGASGATVDEIDALGVRGDDEVRLADIALLGVSHAAYSAWGESLASGGTGDRLSPEGLAGAWGAVRSPTTVGWQSKALDPALGLAFNQARWYAPALGRFTQESPLGRAFEQPYGYAFNSPMAAADVDGLRGLWNPATWLDPNPTGEGFWYTVSPFSDANRDILPSFAHQTVSAGKGVWNSLPFLPEFSTECMDIYDLWSVSWGEAVGRVELELLFTKLGYLLQEWRLARAAPIHGAREWHHWLIPRRWSWVPAGIRDAWWNLSHMSIPGHALADAGRYRFMDAAWKAAHSLPGAISRFLRGVPYGAWFGAGAMGANALDH